jgi:N-acetylglucosaminyl-diphospho-decaprenol L-rhamnosyltransferase
MVEKFCSHELLQNNLVQVSQHTPDAKVVVVDSFSDVPERETVARLAERHGWPTVLSPTKVGFGGGMNKLRGPAGTECPVAYRRLHDSEP